jgi:hypothetical protein
LDDTEVWLAQAVRVVEVISSTTYWCCHKWDSLLLVIWQDDGATMTIHFASLEVLVAKENSMFLSVYFVKDQWISMLSLD